MFILIGLTAGAARFYVEALVAVRVDGDARFNKGDTDDPMGDRLGKAVAIAVVGAAVPLSSGMSLLLGAGLALLWTRLI